MKMSRKAIAASLAAFALPMPMLLGPSASASGWTIYKLAGSSGGSEPGIDIGFDADGDQIVYVHGTYGVPLHNKAWSFNPATSNPFGGSGSFDPIVFSRPFDRLPGGGDADIAFRGDEIWFIDLWVGSNSIQYSPDKGKTWTIGTPFTSLPLSDRQWIALGPTTEHAITGERQTTIYLAYQTFQPGDQAWVSRSDDNGLTWTLHTQLPIGGIPAHIVSDGDRTVAVGILTGQGGRYNVAISRDGGETWSVSDATNNQPDAAGWAVGMTMNPDDADEMAVSYQFGNPVDGGPTSKVGVRVTHDGGSTWSDAIRLDPAATHLGPMDQFPWIDWRGDKIAVAWYQSSEFIPQRNANNGAASNRWSVWYSESVDDGATFSTPIDIGTGTVKTGAICTVGLSCDGDRQLGDFMQLAVDPAGKSWVTFVNVGGAGTLLPGGGIYVLKQP